MLWLLVCLCIFFTLGFIYSCVVGAKGEETITEGKFSALKYLTCIDIFRLFDDIEEYMQVGL